MREVVEQAWAESPRRVILAVLGTIAFVPFAWLLLVVAILAGSPAA